MNSRPSTLNRHPLPSRPSAWSKDDPDPQAVPQQSQNPAARSSGHPTTPTEKSTSRRLHRKQAACYLGTSLSWLDKSRLRGDGPVYLQIGGRVVYDTTDLDTYLASCRRQSTSEQR